MSRVTIYLLMNVDILKGYYLYTNAEDTKPTITSIESSTGLYFYEIGNIFFCPMQWKIVSYVDLKPTQRLWKQVKTHQSQIAIYCKAKNATRYPLTDGSSFTPYEGWNFNSGNTAVETPCNGTK